MKKTVTIGIPVRNEEKTIKLLLDSVIEQYQDNFKLEKIIVIADGSTDKTVEIIEKNFSKSLITVINEKQNKGKAVRLEQLYKLNQSDIIVIFDGDIYIKDKQLISKLVAQFTSKDIGIVSANNQPIKPDTLIGRIWYAEEQLWYETRKDFNNGSNLFNNSGCAVALEKNFSKKIVLPRGTIADQQFVYLNSVLRNKKFVYLDNAVVYYIPPSNLHDITIQHARSLGEEAFLHEKFGNTFDPLFEIPFEHKLKGLFRSVIKDPFFTLTAVLLITLITHIQFDTDPLTKKGTWQTTHSTKKLVQL